MNPDDNAPQKPVMPTTGNQEPERPTPWVPSSESDAPADTGVVGDASGPVAPNDGAYGNGALNTDTFGEPSLPPQPGPGAPQPPMPPAFDTAMPPTGPTPPPTPLPGAVPDPGLPPQQPFSPTPPAPGQPGMLGGAPQFGAPVQPGMPDGNTPIVPIPEQAPPAGVNHTSPVLMIGLLAFGVLLIIGFIVYLFVR